MTVQPHLPPRGIGGRSSWTPQDQLSFDYATIRYGGAMTGDGGIVLYNNGQATLDHSSVSDNNNYGIYFWVQSAGMTAHLSVSNSTVSNNSYAGISSSNAGSIIANISGSIFSNNGSSNGYGIYITGNNTSTITDSMFHFQSRFGNFRFPKQQHHTHQ